jgi:hypothetical protein
MQVAPVTIDPIQITGEGSQAVATIGPMNLATCKKFRCYYFAPDGECLEHCSRDFDSLQARHNLTMSELPPCISVYAMSNGIELAEVTVTAVPGNWSLHKFNNETGAHEGVELLPFTENAPGITVFRHAKAIGSRSDQQNQIAVLVGPLSQQFIDSAS